MIDLDDKELTDQYLKLSKETIVVRSKEELPDDPTGLPEAYSYINFKQNTLLINYLIHDWRIDTYSNRYVRDNLNKTYSWTITIGSADCNVDHDRLFFTRFSILVPAIPENGDVQVWYGVHQIGQGSWDN